MNLHRRRGLGLHQDRYSKLGQLTLDVWRAVRLVVDAGIHTKGWTRRQAFDFFKDNAANTEADIVNEIDRYIARPAQALGPRFDIRAFHDALLATGAVPLDVMEPRMRAWIAAQRATAEQAK